MQEIITRVYWILPSLLVHLIGLKNKWLISFIYGLKNSLEFGFLDPEYIKVIIGNLRLNFGFKLLIKHITGIIELVVLCPTGTPSIPNDKLI